MPAPREILELVARFEPPFDADKSGQHNETQVRREFLNPFFKALGWDIENEPGFAEAYKDVIHEDQIRIAGATKAKVEASAAPVAEAAEAAAHTMKHGLSLLRRMGGDETLTALEKEKLEPPYVGSYREITRIDHASSGGASFPGPPFSRSSRRRPAAQTSSTAGKELNQSLVTSTPTKMVVGDDVRRL